MKKALALKKMLPLWLILVIVLLSSVSLLNKINFQKETFPNLESATVHKIFDGDTLEVQMQDGTFHILELAFIDAPEREQPYGREAVDYLKFQLLNKKILYRNHNDKQIYSAETYD